ncbi:MAG: N-acetylmuramoyl-L-alanine amidase [Oscillospiraceae bacterium]|nr:N-acetylmuramoyl-L-alanine amidase [Oscillospiraceae bacterium]
MIIVMRKKYIAAAAAIAVLTAAAGGFAQTVVRSGKSIYRDISVIVDAGHGSPDGGAVGVSGTQEKDVNLAIALMLKTVLESKGIPVIMTRSGDNAIYDKSAKTIREKKRSDMNNRLKIMNESNAGLFISIHMNSFEDKSVNGVYLFYNKNHPEIKTLAENIQNNIHDITGARTHDIKTAESRLFLMKNAVMPAILIECGFLTNYEEEKNLLDDEYREKIAWAIGDAISDYYKNKEKDGKESNIKEIEAG